MPKVTKALTQDEIEALRGNVLKLPTPEPPTPELLEALRKKVAKLEKYKKLSRSNFMAADRAANELIGLLRTIGGELDLGDGRKAQLVDNFAADNKIFRNQYFVRFEVVIS